MINRLIQGALQNLFSIIRKKMDTIEIPRLECFSTVLVIYIYKLGCLITLIKCLTPCSNYIPTTYTIIIHNV